MSATNSQPLGLSHKSDGRTLVMGVLNVTPDSFSDGGEYLEESVAISRGLELVAQGADIVDVGGESTRPGATRVSTEEEIARTISVVTSLSESGATVSIDTMRSSVAKRAVDGGAALVNDVSGGLADESMFAVVAQLQVPIVIMHWRAHSEQMERYTHYDDVVVEVRDHLSSRIEAALEAGIEESKIIIDPGLGFAKKPQHNWLLLRHFDQLQSLGFPVLIGASRKRFLRVAVSEPDQDPRAFDDLAAATDAVSALAAQAGAWAVRVHDVPGSVDAVTVAHLWRG